MAAEYCGCQMILCLMTCGNVGSAGDRSAGRADCSPTAAMTSTSTAASSGPAASPRRSPAEAFRTAPAWARPAGSSSGPSPGSTSSKRIRIRYEIRADLHLGLLQLACSINLLETASNLILKRSVSRRGITGHSGWTSSSRSNSGVSVIRLRCAADLRWKSVSVCGRPQMCVPVATQIDARNGGVSRFRLTAECDAECRCQRHYFRSHAVTGRRRPAWCRWRCRGASPR